MEVTKIICSGFAATSLMTAFSYLVSRIKNKQFREPELLNILISRSDLLNFKLSKKSSVGWVLHYVIGWIFVIIFDVLWKFNFPPFSVLSGALLGLVAGIIGVFGWKIFFSLSNNPPKIDWSEYYLQLIIAHIIFGVTAALVFLSW
ncbi:hypothetical protein L1I30_03995 [Gillisia sp. M10.2A]|uniref:DUF2938 domain-containing protein n=1 Tax=Gillisia lutea TaxID=2909668 RepID=A0ABS9ED59_9FLAO|nr:hypothetical protein [Gillisia lutea]MCF4100821.1 hypothetical protein [Gillisia lutea]